MIFVDTSAWIASLLAGDKNAEAARRFQRELARGSHGALITTDYVLDEAATLLRARGGIDAAAKFLDGVLASPTLRLMWIGPDLFRAAVAVMAEGRDKRWSFTDCTSFALMRSLGISKAFAFDHNFEQAGFTRLP